MSEVLTLEQTPTERTNAAHLGNHDHNSSGNDRFGQHVLQRRAAVLLVVGLLAGEREDCLVRRMRKQNVGERRKTPFDVASERIERYDDQQLVDGGPDELRERVGHRFACTSAGDGENRFARDQPLIERFELVLVQPRSGRQKLMVLSSEHTLRNITRTSTHIHTDASVCARRFHSSPRDKLIL